MQLNNEWVKILIFIIKHMFHWPLMTCCPPRQLICNRQTRRGPTYGNMIHRVISYSLWVHTSVITTPSRICQLNDSQQWLNISMISVFTNIQYIMQVKHETFMISCHACSEGGAFTAARLWRHYLFTYSRYRFSSCQRTQSTNIPQCGSGQLGTCLRNSRQ